MRYFMYCLSARAAKAAGLVLAAACVLVALTVCPWCPVPAAIAAPSVGSDATVTSPTGDAEAQTEVKVYMDALRILEQTPDLAGSANELLGGPGQVQVSLAGGLAPYPFTWTRTVDGQADTTFSEEGICADASTPVIHGFTPGELVEGHEYVYKLVVYDTGGAEAQHVETAIRVLCSSDYGWRDGADEDDEGLGDDGYSQVDEPLYFHDESTGADIKVAGYLHRSARIIVTPLEDFDPARLVLETSAGSARVTGAWVIEVVFEGGAPEEGIDAFVGDVHVSVRFPGQESVRVAAASANVEGMRASVRVGDTWDFPESVLFLGPDALVQRPDCAVDDAREWLSFETEILGAFATLGEKVPGSGHSVALEVQGGGQVTPAPLDDEGRWKVADGGMLRTVLLPDAGFVVGTVEATGGMPVSVSGNQVTVGPVTADCTLRVTFEKVVPDPSVTHTLTTEVVGGHGSVEPADPVQVTHGGSAFVQFLPDAGYVIDQVLVNGQAVTAFADSYVVSAMTEDVHVAVTYRAGTPAPQLWFKVQTKVVAGEGSVSPEAALVQLGGRAAFSFLPADGWDVADVTVNGASVGPVSSYVMENILSDGVVEVSFEQGEDPGVDPDPDPGGDPDPDPDPEATTFAIRATSGNHGHISPEGEVSVVKGADAAFTFVPDGGFRVSDVVVDGKSIGVPSAYTLRKVEADHTIHVEFAPVYDTPGSGGSGSSSGGSGGQPLGGAASVKTGDTVATVAVIVFAGAVLAGVMVLIARYRLRRRR